MTLVCRFFMARATLEEWTLDAPHFDDLCRRSRVDLLTSMQTNDLNEKRAHFGRVVGDLRVNTTPLAAFARVRQGGIFTPSAHSMEKGSEGNVYQQHHGETTSLRGSSNDL